MTCSTEIKDQWYLLVNPVAGGGEALLNYPSISKLLHDEQIICDPHFTDHKFHAVELTVKAISDGYRKIIVLGGDGTLHEVVNGLFIQECVAPSEVLIGVIGVGSGNGWLRNFGFEEGRYTPMIKAIKAEESILQDVGAVSYEEAHYRQTRYMIGASSTGFGAYVTKKFNHRNMKRRQHRWSYLMCVIRSFFQYRNKGAKVFVDGKRVYNDMLFGAAIGVVRYNGDGLQHLPNAIVDDGFLDMTLIRPLHFWHLLFRIHYLFNGDIYRIGHVLKFRGESIRIESIPEMMVEVDGELLGGTPLEFTVHHRAIRVVVGREFLDHQ